jgi:hypothetical protein
MPECSPEMVQCAAISAGLTPLEYMLAVMRDEKADPARRDRMAIAAATFCHPRMSDNRVSKKTKKAAAAKTAGVGSAWKHDLAFGDEAHAN